MDAGELVQVRILKMPLQLTAEAREHSDGLNREFALIATGLGSDSVPARLQQLSEQLESRYSMFTEDQQRELDEAIARGDDSMDITYTLPKSVADACYMLNDMLEEADAFCQTGDLLTLATPPEYVRLRRWFLAEFIRQAHSGDPVAWPDYDDEWPPATPNT